MIPSRRMLKALAALLPLGAFGVSVTLAATPAKAADALPAQRDVAQRLQAIRDAVSTVTAEQTGLPPGDPNIERAWWSNWGPPWRNGGWRNGGWRNGGWRNAGWGNAPWGNGWINGPPWNNWNNFWRNW